MLAYKRLRNIYDPKLMWILAYNGCTNIELSTDAYEHLLLFDSRNKAETDQEYCCKTIPNQCINTDGNSNEAV